MILMSSSKKKQLRKEQYMTERQAAAAQEAKKLKRYTLTFWVVIALVLCVFVGAVTVNPIKNVIYKNTDAMIVGDYTLSSVDVNYFYMDAVNNYVNQYSSYISLILDVSKPLNEQYVNMEDGITWADSFLTSATDTIKSTYALYDMAVKNGHELTEEEQKAIDGTIATYELYAAYYGYQNIDSYLRAVYGNGACEESYRHYLEVSALASSYLTAYSDSLEYTPEQLHNYQAATPHKFNAYTFAVYYVNASSYREGGTKDDKGNTVYTEEEKANAIKAAELAANLLADEFYADLAEFDGAIKLMPINKDNATAASTKYEGELYDEINSLFRDWLTGKVESEDEDAEPTFIPRKTGDMTVIPYTTGSGESEVINGYYVIRFGSTSDNNFFMKNVRHVLIAFEGGKTDATTGVKTYSAEEKAAAKDKAEKLLADWVAAGDLSEDSFAELAKENSKDGNAAQGGLYEDVYPGQMVEPFEDWCYDAERKVGDYGIVETEYGYHIMFFVGDSDTTFRDFMTTNVMTNEDMEKWHNSLIEAITVTTVTTKHIMMDLVLSH